jgi:hypothetical protein
MECYKLALDYCWYKVGSNGTFGYKLLKFMFVNSGIFVKGIVYKAELASGSRYSLSSFLSPESPGGISSRFIRAL